MGLNGDVVEYDLTDDMPDLSGCNVIESIVVTPSDEVRFSCNNWGTYIGKMSSSGAVTIYTPDTTIVYIGGIEYGPDGNIWFSGGGPNDNGPTDNTYLVKMSTSGEVLEEYDLATHSSNEDQSGEQAENLTLGPDGNFWIGLADIGYMARVTLTGQVTKFEVGGYGGSGPMDFVLGSDNKFWFLYSTGEGNVSIGGMDMNGNLETIFSESGLGEGSYTGTLGIMSYLTEAPDGSLVFGGLSYDGTTYTPAIFHATKAGQVRKFLAPTLPDSQGAYLNAALHLVNGPDGEVWFASLSMSGNDNPGSKGSFFRVVITPDDNGTPPTPINESPTPTPPRTGQLIGLLVASSAALGTFGLFIKSQVTKGTRQDRSVK